MASEVPRTAFPQDTPEPETLLRAIVDSSDDAIVSKDLNSIVTSWNRSAERIFGYTAEEMIGQSITLLIPPERAKEEDEILAKIRSGNRVDHFETVRRRKDGRLIDVSVSISPIFSSSGKVVGASKVARDVSDVKRNALSDQLLAAIVNSSDDAIISKKLDGTVTSWNDGAERIFGYQAAEIVGQSVMKLVPDTRKAEEGTILDQLKRGERIDHFETVRVRKNGEHFDVSLTISPVRNALGEIVGASKVARDISDAKRAARADLLLSAIVNSSDDAVISKNLDGIITSWNAAAERIFGYEADEIIGKSVLTLIPPDRADEEPKILARLRRGERVEHFETIRRRKNGELVPLSLTISPIRNALGEIIGASKIARHISELKRIAAEKEALLESERAARSQAEHANRMKDDFLATVSHELRTPLNAIIGWTDVLAEGGQHPEEVAQGISVIRNSAMMQAQLIEDLLDLGSITSGKMILRVERVQLKEIVAEAMASVQHAADAKQIVLRSAISDLTCALLADSRRLQQVVWNLLINAIKFTDSGGQVRLSVSQVGAFVEIDVTDNGRGIAPAFLPHLFERFRQADASTTRHHGGLGIGLALVKQLVELHGGTVTAESAGLGHGATFKVKLPISATRTPDPERSKMVPSVNLAALADLSAVRVIAVDDDEDSLDVVKRILAGRNADIRTARSVDEALEVLRTFTPHVVLSDVGMPGRDGYEFVRWLRESSFFNAVPAVALTALARVEDRTRALDAGFQTHIAKPVAAAELVAVVQSLAKLHSAREAEVLTSRERTEAFKTGPELAETERGS